MKITAQTTLQSYLETVYVEDRINLRASTVSAICYSIRAYARFLERSPTIADLNKDTITSFMAWYAQRVAGSTVNAKRKDLLALWRVAWDKRHTRVAPRKIARARESQPEAPKSVVIHRLEVHQRGKGKEVPVEARDSDTQI